MNVSSPFFMKSFVHRSHMPLPRCLTYESVFESKHHFSFQFFKLFMVSQKHIHMDMW